MYTHAWCTVQVVAIMYEVILYFVWADQRDKVCFIFHKVQGCWDRYKQWNGLQDWTTGLSHFPFLDRFMCLFLEEA